jgi:hypothetical protein
MAEQTVRKTYKYKLKPTPKQEWELERVLMLCRYVYNAAVEERREAWRMRGVFLSYYQQKAELPDIKLTFRTVNCSIHKIAHRPARGGRGSVGAAASDAGSVR